MDIITRWLDAFNIPKVPIGYTLPHSDYIVSSDSAPDYNLLRG
jgi:hypothetical protein